MNYFDEFWKLYPRKVCKKNAIRAFDSIKPDKELFERIIQAIKNHAKTDQWKKDGGKFIPHPATWLRAERWEDELEIKLPSTDSVPVMIDCRLYIVKGAGEYMVCQKRNDCRHAFTPECNFLEIEKDLKRKTK